MKTKIRQFLNAKLIFNPTSGKPGESPDQLLEIITEMQKQRIIPEVHVLQDDNGIHAVVRRALKDGTRLIVASGGDGSVDSVAAAIAGKSLTLGILPTGTSNNLALNLRIPRNMAEAVDILRSGTQVKIDLGAVTSQRKKKYFLEFVSLGLLTDVFPASEDFRRGDLLKAGEFLSTVAASSPSLITLELDKKEQINLAAFSVVVTNMPYIGRNFRIDRSVSFRDRRLDVFVFTELSKMGLLNSAVRYLNGEIHDETVKHFKVKQVRISTRPQMAINVDGQPLPDGVVKIRVQPEALTVMAGSTKGYGPRRREVPELLKVTDGK